MNDREIAFMPAVQMAQQFRAQQLSPVEVTDLFLDRIERLNPSLLAYCIVTPEIARAAARQAEQAFMTGEGIGALCGIPVSIKDLLWTTEIRTTRGSLLHQDFVAVENSPCVDRVLEAGAVVLGKTNTPEYGWRGTTDNRLFGISRNPWDLEKTPGGSSGGASAQVAAGLGPLGIGTDGGGSIRIPSSFTGIYGLKPTAGRVAVYPASIFGSLSHVGPMTRTVDDAALFLNVLTGHDDRDRYSLPAESVDYLQACVEGRAKGLSGLKVAWSPDLGFGVPVEPEVLEQCHSAALRFGELGCVVEEASPAGSWPADAFQTLWYAGAAVALGDVAQNPDQASLLDPGLLEIVKKGLQVSAVDYARATTLTRGEYWLSLSRFFRRYDLLLTPTLPLTAFTAGLLAPPSIAGIPMDDLSLGWTPFTPPFNLTGQPAATIPCGFSRDGLPIGLQIIGRRYADYTVLQASAAFESLLPWAGYYPSHS